MPEGQMTYEEKMIACLKLLRDNGRTLEYCTDALIMGRKINTLKKYCRLGGLIFSDYCPQALKKKKDAK